MHLLFRETRGLDDDAPAVDLEHAPADIVLLSFSDGDIACAAMGGPPPGVTLRTAPLARLRHPLSVDLYAERTVAHSGCVIARILGGLDYWRYGAEELAALCAARAIPLALLPGDDRPDPRLAALSNVDAATLDALDTYFRHGGPENVAQALRLAAALAGHHVPPPSPPRPVPRAGEHALAVSADGPLGRTAIVFYRSHLLAADIAPIEALARALSARGLGVRALYVSSLKESEPAAIVAARLAEWRPRVVLNATAFSSGAAPLSVADAPVLQLVLAGSTRDTWDASPRGLSQTDLAMHVVLPELDGRLLTTATSFKKERDGRTIHAPHAPGVALAADRAAGWARLAATPARERRVAIVLSDYPGGGQAGHALGLDSFASLDAIGRWLQADLSGLAHAPPTPILGATDYARLFATLPDTLRADVLAAWGPPPADAVTARVVGDDTVFAALQPDRGHALDRRAAYHDPALPPCHGFIGFHLWLREIRRVHAIVQLGAHGTLEWLPGKAAALSSDCAPAALLGGVPVIYPFIVTNPGEAACAKRRLGAATLGHLPPPLVAAGSHGAAARLERLIDEYAAADGLDSRRAAILRREIVTEADATGLLEESGAARATDETATLATLDAWLCEVKERRISDGLHVFGAGGCGAEERAALLAALDGRFVPPGPAGAPSQNRADVLPTGRNLYSVDPRAVPARSAVALAERAAEDLLRRHVQDHGDWPRALVIDAWGSAAMRTGGQDVALALVLMGARPLWDADSARVSGIEVLPLALLDRPRVDVTLRISGLFRDAFEALVALFDQAVRAIAARDESDRDNPLAATARDGGGTARVFGPAPGAYGAGVLPLLQRDAWRARAELGASYAAASAHAYGRAVAGADFAARLGAAEAFVRARDLAEGDLLDDPEHAAHLGGFAAAAEAAGAAPALYQLDLSGEQPRARGVTEELAMVVRARAANPAWIAGMRRHGYRGAAEIARTVAALHAYAATLPTRLDRQFDLLFDATLGDGATDAFLRDANPEAHAAIAARFDDARMRGLWHPQRNDFGRNDFGRNDP